MDQTRMRPVSEFCGCGQCFEFHSITLFRDTAISLFCNKYITHHTQWS